MSWFKSAMPPPSMQKGCWVFTRNSLHYFLTSCLKSEGCQGCWARKERTQETLGSRPAVIGWRSVRQVYFLIDKSIFYILGGDSCVCLPSLCHFHPGPAGLTIAKMDGHNRIPNSLSAHVWNVLHFLFSDWSANKSGTLGSFSKQRDEEYETCRVAELGTRQLGYVLVWTVDYSWAQVHRYVISLPFLMFILCANVSGVITDLYLLPLKHPASSCWMLWLGLVQAWCWAAIFVQWNVVLT